MNRPFRPSPDEGDPSDAGAAGGVAGGRSTAQPHHSHSDLRDYPRARAVANGDAGGDSQAPSVGNYSSRSNNGAASSSMEASNHHLQPAHPPLPPTLQPQTSSSMSTKFSQSVPGLKFVSKLTGLSFFSKARNDPPPPPPPTTTPTTEPQLHEQEQPQPAWRASSQPPTTNHDHGGDPSDNEGSPRSGPAGSSTETDVDDDEGLLPPSRRLAGSSTDTDEDEYRPAPEPPHNADPLNAYGSAETAPATVAAAQKPPKVGDAVPPPPSRYRPVKDVPVPRRRPLPQEEEDDDNGSSDDALPPPPSQSRPKVVLPPSGPPPSSGSRPKARPPVPSMVPPPPVHVPVPALPGGAASQPAHPTAVGTTTAATTAATTLFAAGPGADSGGAARLQGSRRPSPPPPRPPSTDPAGAASTSSYVPRLPTPYAAAYQQPPGYPYPYPAAATATAPTHPWGAAPKPAPPAAAASGAAATAAATTTAKVTVTTLARGWPPDKAAATGDAPPAAGGTKANPSAGTGQPPPPQPPPPPHGQRQAQPQPPPGSNAYRHILPYPAPGYAPYYPAYHYPTGYATNYYQHQATTTAKTTAATANANAAPVGKPSAAATTTNRSKPAAAAAAAAASKGPSSKSKIGQQGTTDKARRASRPEAWDFEDSHDDDDGTHDEEEEDSPGWQLLQKMARELQAAGPHGVPGRAAGRPGIVVGDDPGGGLHEARLSRKRVRENDALSIVPYPPRTIGSVRDNLPLLPDDAHKYIKRRNKKDGKAKYLLPSAFSAIEAKAARRAAKRAVIVNERIVPGLCTSAVDRRWKDLMTANDAPDPATVGTAPTATDTGRVPAVLVHDLMLSPSKVIPSSNDSLRAVEPAATEPCRPAGSTAPQPGATAAPGPSATSEESLSTVAALSPATVAPCSPLPSAASRPAATMPKETARGVPPPPSLRSPEVSGTCVERYWHKETQELQRFLSAVKRCVNRRSTSSLSLAGTSQSQSQVADGASAVPNVEAGEMPIDRQARQFLDVLEQDVAAVRKAASLAEKNARTYLHEVDRPLRSPQEGQRQSSASSVRQTSSLTDADAVEGAQDTATGTPELSAEAYQKRIVSAAREAAIFRETARIIRRKARELCERRTGSAP